MGRSASHPPARRSNRDSAQEGRPVRRRNVDVVVSIQSQVQGRGSYHFRMEPTGPPSISSHAMRCGFKVWNLACTTEWFLFRDGYRLLL